MVYVGIRTYRYRDMIMSHMVADTLDELHDMAKKLNLYGFFQNIPGKPHYDICKAKKAQAKNFGAIEVNDREIVVILKKQYGKSEVKKERRRKTT